MGFTGKTIAEIKKILDEAMLGALTERERAELLYFLDNDRRAGVKALAVTFRATMARRTAEDKRQAELSKYEQRLYSQGFKLVAGVDEAGRGALAGPLVAAAVILPRDARIPGIRDSKKLLAEQREQLYERIVETAISWSAVSIESTEIDSRGLQWANLKALERAARTLSHKSDYALIDGFDVKALEIPSLALIKGDSRSISIAAASIVAKVTRDRIMCDLHKAYPAYGFDQHKGYGTAAHLEALAKHGSSAIHRKSFAPVAELDHEQLKL